MRKGTDNRIRGKRSQVSLTLGNSTASTALHRADLFKDSSLFGLIAGTKYDMACYVRACNRTNDPVGVRNAVEEKGLGNYSPSQ